MNKYLEALPYIRIPLHGKNGEGKFTLVDGDYDGEYFSQFKWLVMPNGYVVRCNYENYDSKAVTKTGKKKGYGNYIYLHREVSRTPKGLVTDHINRNKLDNRSCNLRWTDYSGNAMNRSTTIVHKRITVYGYGGR
jgi:hypothetical protein